ncbi:hypothetical protein CCACVL1_12854 [Corchorus capsularis]|uniref:Uncharacterized protein n=1 Tax=Corchorus capsularis TaxID=210143 RepID=A0A1R3IDL2_COCAP|nr:hypothetical protein CCACVL1_12854 [Corchorus capsularis]
MALTTAFLVLVCTILKLRRKVPSDAEEIGGHAPIIKVEEIVVITDEDYWFSVGPLLGCIVAFFMRASS